MFFTPEVLDKSIIAAPLFKELEAHERQERLDANAAPGPINVIIDLNLKYHAGRDKARERAIGLIEDIWKENTVPKGTQDIRTIRSRYSPQYLYAALHPYVIRELARRDADGENDAAPAAPAPALPAAVPPPPTKLGSAGRAIYHLWPDFVVEPLTTRSVSTVKADAARNTFAALGEGVVWAVIDSGVDHTHPHFSRYRNLDLELPLKHTDFVTENEADALTDPRGHGTHVAGIIAGEFVAGKTVEVTEPQPGRPVQTTVVRQIEAVATRRNEQNASDPHKVTTIERISGMAPRCKILSLRVLDGAGTGQTSSVIAALEYVQELNGYGRHLRVHGVNLSVGYTFDPEWFACGQSPLCVEVNRLVKSGVVVVVAAGNTGYGVVQSQALGPIASGMDLSINDPGNAELAITVGSTHRDSPHTYGVSYFSSKGPTGDGRLKPDLVAPGERIISCAAPVPPSPPPPPVAPGADPVVEVVASYKEDSGTSMAAPHVSGVVAGFLSVRREFVGRPEAVKEVFLNSATDLKRVPAFQGRGLVDMMRALQSV